MFLFDQIRTLVAMTTCSTIPKTKVKLLLCRCRYCTYILFYQKRLWSRPLPFMWGSSVIFLVVEVP